MHEPRGQETSGLLEIHQITERLASPSSVVASQFAALEDPAGEERVLQVEGSLTPSELLARAIDWIGAQSLRPDCSQ